MKKGFTLVELIGVVIILGLIALIAFPSILNAIRESENEISDASKEILYSATSQYVSENANSFPKVNGNTFCVPLNSLVQGEYLPTKVYDATNGEEIPLTSIVEVKYEQDRFSYNLNNECVEKIESIPNPPELLTNMIPIKYNGSNWVYADINERWYDYGNKEWANAVVLNDNVTKNVGDTITEEEIALWYVWIPRYKYQLFNANNGSVQEQLINVTFESGTASTGTVSCTDAVTGSGSSSETCMNASNGNWYTHPAFTFGDEELTGFWVGKFEVSTTDNTCNNSNTTDNCNKISKVTIKPGISSWRYATVSNFFTSIQNIKSDYNIRIGDSHMMKNMEWGAVAYLKQSKYGLGATDIISNTNSDFYTGGGTGNLYKSNIGQSTTGNIYGIYDMAGGTNEYVMGNMVNSEGLFYSGNSGFSSAPDAKYYDQYTYGTNELTHGRGKLGDATKEVVSTLESIGGGWYNDYADFVDSGYPWFIRGSFNNGTYIGIFSFSGYTGSVYNTGSSRAVLTP